MGLGPSVNQEHALSGLHGRMLPILPAFDAALETCQSLRDIAQAALDGAESSIQTGDLAPEEPADRKHREGVDQYLHVPSE